MFTRKNVIVTGGSRGIGRAIVEEFAAQNANVAFTYLSNKDAAHSLLDVLQSKYQRQQFMTCRCDANDRAVIAELVNNYLAMFGSVDVLVNNAGITRDGVMASMGAEQWQSVIDTNLGGVFNLTKHIIFEMMKQHSGSIVNITSVSGIHGNAGQVNYSSAKAGLIGFTKALSKEVVGMGVRVNAVAPGFIETDMTASLIDAQKKKFTSSIGMKRMGAPHEVAKVVAFMASEQASYITGQVLAVDGGLVI